MALTDLILNISVEEILNVLLLTLISAAFIKKHFESKWLQTHYFCTLSISERFAIQEGCMLANSLQLKLIIGVFFPSCFTFFFFLSKPLLLIEEMVIITLAFTFQTA